MDTKLADELAYAEAWVVIGTEWVKFLTEEGITNEDEEWPRAIQFLIEACASWQQAYKSALTDVINKKAVGT